MLTVLLHPRPTYHQPGNLASEVVDWLKKADYLPKAAELADYRSFNYVVQAHGRRTLDTIAQSYQPYVKAFYSTELIDSFANHIDSWSSALSS